MGKKILSVIDTAYRATQEEQDDAGLWFSGAVRNAGLDVDILLTGNGVNYAVKGHPKTSLTVGGGEVSHPFNPEIDLERLAANGAKLYMVREDVEERGIETSTLIGSIEQIDRLRLPEFVGEYESIWRW